METLVAFVVSVFVYAILDHWRGGARLFRGKKNAEAAEKFAMTDGKEGYRTWYWDMGVLPYVVFGISTFALVFAVGGIDIKTALTALVLCGTYYFFRSQSPRELFRAGDGTIPRPKWTGLRDIPKNIKEWSKSGSTTYAGIVAGAKLGFIGLLPALLLVPNAWWLIFTPLFGLPLGIYHTLFHGNPLFRSYGELCQGGLVIAPVIYLNLLAL